MDKQDAAEATRQKKRASEGAFKPIVLQATGIIGGPANDSVDSVDSVEEKDGPWDPPIPLEAFAVPPFPVDKLPPALARWVTAIAENTQTPAEIAGLMCFGVLSAACARRFEVEIKPGWTEPVNLFLLAAADSGSRKSAVVNQAIAPLLAHERDLIAAAAPLVAESENARRILEKRLERTQANAAKLDDANERGKVEAEAAELARRLAESKPAEVPTVVLDDATPEKINNVMSNNGERAAIISAEGGIFDLIAGKYSDGVASLDPFLKAHAGDPIRVDRMGRATDSMTRPALTMAVAAQPAVLRGLTTRPGFREKGLPARFLFAVPRSLVGFRSVDAPAVPASVVDEYAAVVRHLCADRVPAVPTIVRFSPEAWALFRVFCETNERRMAPGCDLELLTDWGSKFPGALARLAGLFHALDRGGDVLEATQVDRVLGFADYFTAHARAAFALMGADPSSENARALLVWARQKGRRAFSKRDAFKDLRSRFQQAVDLDAPLSLLVGHGFIREMAPDPSTRAGRKPSPRFVTHPSVLVHANPSTQSTQSTQSQGPQ